MTTGTCLSIADLEAFDPAHKRRDGETRVCCPLCGGAKPIDQSHRSLAYNAQTGLYSCHRCKAKGQLTDFWKPLERAPFDPKKSSFRSRNRSTPTLPPITPPKTPKKSPAEIIAIAKGNGAILPATTPICAAYLKSRGLDPEFCQLAGVRFAPYFHSNEKYSGSPAVIFPLKNDVGKLVAIQGRYINPTHEPRMRTVGEKTFGVFSTPGAIDKNTLPVFVEAPIDALSLAMAGVSAIAVCGSDGFAPCISRKLAPHDRIIAAFDDDDAGEKATVALATAIVRFGVVKRFRPTGAKDWNDYLKIQGIEALRKLVRPLIPDTEPTVPQSPQSEPEHVSGTLPDALIQAASGDYANFADTPAIPPFAVSSSENDSDFSDVEMLPPFVFFADLLTLAEENQLPAEPVKIREGVTVINPNVFVIRSIERAEGLKRRFSAELESEQEAAFLRQCLESIRRDMAELYHALLHDSAHGELRKVPKWTPN